MEDQESGGEKIRFWRPPGIDGVEVLSAENSPRLWKVFHETFTVCTVTGFEGVSEWDHRSRRHVSGQGSLMLMDQGELHNTRRLTGRGTFWVLMMETAFMSRIALETLGHSTPRWKVSDFRDPEVFNGFTGLQGVLASDSSLLEKESCLEECVSLLLARAAERAPMSPPGYRREGLRRAKDYLHEHLSEDVRLEKLADIAGSTKSHFCRSFAAEFGVSPHQYQLRLRIAKAKSMLAEGILFKASDLGFCDQPQFIRAFKCSLGVTPGDYARQVRPAAAKRAILFNTET